ncbi:hypothetical protein J8273_2767 [Carpediemonas membranifera]|uniref:Uncharacterized protein n=1 Tax=Carpediemonas membranifera TaxID=201153 RepID=A0A8J6AZ33_9EUKA|nr:hypothetical protein J8273_2767 [Carpediemonas membranifera]|eukprot:KAG9395855.1 hypothetical protein J8273_2767 [Carpediemonas membranifera]
MSAVEIVRCVHWTEDHFLLSESIKNEDLYGMVSLHEEFNSMQYGPGWCALITNDNTPTFWTTDRVVVKRFSDGVFVEFPISRVIPIVASLVPPHFVPGLVSTTIDLPVFIQSIEDELYRLDESLDDHAAALSPATYRADREGLVRRLHRTWELVTTGLQNTMRPLADNPANFPTVAAAKRFVTSDSHDFGAVVKLASAVGVGERPVVITEADLRSDADLLPGHHEAPTDHASADQARVTARANAALAAMYRLSWLLSNSTEPAHAETLAAVAALTHPTSPARFLGDWVRSCSEWWPVACTALAPVPWSDSVAPVEVSRRVAALLGGVDAEFPAPPQLQQSVAPSYPVPDLGRLTGRVQSAEFFFWLLYFLRNLYNHSGDINPAVDITALHRALNCITGHNTKFWPELQAELEAAITAIAQSSMLPRLNQTTKLTPDTIRTILAPRHTQLCPDPAWSIGVRVFAAVYREVFQDKTQTHTSSAVTTVLALSDLRLCAAVVRSVIGWVLDVASTIHDEADRLTPHDSAELIAQILCDRVTLHIKTPSIPPDETRIAPSGHVPVLGLVRLLLDEGVLMLTPPHETMSLPHMAGRVVEYYRNAPMVLANVSNVLGGLWGAVLPAVDRLDDIWSGSAPWQLPLVYGALVWLGVVRPPSLVVGYGPVLYRFSSVGSASNRRSFKVVVTSEGTRRPLPNFSNGVWSIFYPAPVTLPDPTGLTSSQPCRFHETDPPRPSLVGVGRVLVPDHEDFSAARVVRAVFGLTTPVSEIMRIVTRAITDRPHLRGVLHLADPVSAALVAAMPDAQAAVVFAGLVWGGVVEAEADIVIGTTRFFIEGDQLKKETGTHPGKLEYCFDRWGICCEQEMP